VPARGPVGAPATIAVFSDFQCPFCAGIAKTLDSLAEAEGDRLRIVYHYFPLPMHHWARQAAIAGACAATQNNASFWNFHNYVFAHQHELSPENFAIRASDWELGVADLDAKRFEWCLSQGGSSGRIEQDIALGEELGVHSTPTLFLNGEPIEARSMDELRSLVSRAANAR
jgi:protein-disulfide isomerase